MKDGGTAGYVLRALDGKPFLVKYGEPLIKEGRLHSLVIWLIGPNVSKRDIVLPSYVSETFSHFFGPDRDASEDYLELDDRGLVVAEITLKADESGLLYLIADLNCKHIQEVVLDKYYSSHRGEYDFIGRSMVGIAEEQAGLKQTDININIIAMRHEIIGHHNRIIPVFDLSRIEEIEIGIRPHKKGNA